MELALRDEILVVVDYEGHLHATELKLRVERFRRSRKDFRILDKDDLSKILFSMVEQDFLLEPWVVLQKNKNLFIRVGELHGEDPLGREPLNLFYRLTPHGWKEQRTVLNSLVQARPKKFLKKGKGQS